MYAYEVVINKKKLIFFSLNIVDPNTKFNGIIIDKLIVFFLNTVNKFKNKKYWFFFFFMYHTNMKLELKSNV